ncbi:MAG: glycosyltransferase family 1 protein [Salinarimonas sp.]|nr:glycosyltransferase family 1 protein [Salinarimonas sp.]
MVARAADFGFEATVLEPGAFRSVPMPTYPEIRLALPRPSRIARFIVQVKPQYVHIATEGPIGLMVRRYCLARGLAFSTGLHTRFPEYAAARFPLSERPLYRMLRWFHAPADCVMVGTQTMHDELAAKGFDNLVLWQKGVDCAQFRPRTRKRPDGAPPIFLTVARLAVEKNLEAFLALDLPGQKIVVGDGPDRERLQAIDPSARFLGKLTGEPLAEIYRSADVFVFPSLTDTFGIVMLEALASGVPVAAYPVPGPLDVLGSSGAGVMDWDLRRAIMAARGIEPAVCRAHAEGFDWIESARQFYGHVVAYGLAQRDTRRDTGGPMPFAAKA